MYKSQALRSYTSLGQIVIYLVSTAATASISAIYAPVICIHCSPHLRGWAGIMGFHFPEPWYKPALLGKADDNNPALCPTLHNRKSQQGKCPNVIPPHFPGTAGTIKKVLSSTLPRLSHGYPRRWGPWIQMTGALSSLNIV